MELRVKNVNGSYKIYVESSNSKLGNIANFSVKKGTEAYCNKNCNKCYCNHLQMYDAHVRHVGLNFKAVDDSINDNILKDNIINAISNYILLNGCDVFRFNVEGDINSNYLNVIIEVAKKNPDCLVYCYTKNYDVVEKQLHNIVTVNNLTILLSIMCYNDSNIIDKFKEYDNIKFFITTRSDEERLIYYKTYDYPYFYTCKSDNNKDMKCKACKLCYNSDSKFIFNQYKGIKKVKKETIPYADLFFKTSNRFQNNEFLNNALNEALIAVFCHTTATKKELSNLERLASIKIRSFSKNACKQYGQCARFNNDYYKITINNMNYYKTVCTLIHELLHVLVFSDGHAGKFDKYAAEIEENTIFSCRGKKQTLNNINYKSSLQLENTLIKRTIDICITYLHNSGYMYLTTKSKNKALMEISNRISNFFNKMESEDLHFDKYTNLRSLITRCVKNTLVHEYNNILKNIND